MRLRYKRGFYTPLKACACRKKWMLQLASWVCGAVSAQFYPWLLGAIQELPYLILPMYGVSESTHDHSPYNQHVSIEIMEPCTLSFLVTIKKTTTQNRINLTHITILTRNTSQCLHWRIVRKSGLCLGPGWRFFTVLWKGLHLFGDFLTVFTHFCGNRFGVVRLPGSAART